MNFDLVHLVEKITPMDLLGIQVYQENPLINLTSTYIPGNKVLLSQSS